MIPHLPPDGGVKWSIKVMENIKEKKLDVFLDSGVAFQVDQSFEEVMAIVEDSTVQPDDFVYLKYLDGCRLSIRKRNITAVSEYQDD